MTKYKASFLGKKCIPVSICNPDTLKEDKKVWRIEMFQYLVFLVLVASGKFSHEGVHAIDHEKNVLIPRCKEIYITI